MRKIESNDSVFEKLITGKDEFLYNIIFLIRDCENPLLLTDDKTCIFAQSNINTPIWIFLNQKPEGRTKKELVNALLDSLLKNPNVKINGMHEYLAEILYEISKKTGKKYIQKTLMNVYACFDTISVPEKGEMAAPQESYKADMAQLMKQMVLDIEKRELSRTEAESFADDMVNSKDLFLWKDGQIKSMALITHRTEKYARINTVVTKKECRGNGYGAMLVKAMSDAVLKEGRIPMLYAEADYPPSNRMYLKIGYEKQGQIGGTYFL